MRKRRSRLPKIVNLMQERAEVPGAGREVLAGRAERVETALTVARMETASATAVVTRAKAATATAAARAAVEAIEALTVVTGGGVAVGARVDGDVVAAETLGGGIERADMLQSRHRS